MVTKKLNLSSRSRHHSLSTLVAKLGISNREAESQAARRQLTIDPGDVNLSLSMVGQPNGDVLWRTLRCVRGPSKPYLGLVQGDMRWTTLCEEQENVSYKNLLQILLVYVRVSDIASLG